MDYTPTYRAAREVSRTVYQHFERHGTADAAGARLAEIPSAQVVEAMVDIAFWTSLRKEEGNSPRISLVYLSPDQAEKNLVLTKPLPLTPDNLKRLAPGLERPGIHVGVYLFDDKLYIWGTTMVVPERCFVLDVSEPALLVVKHRSASGYGKFTNVAVLQGDQVKIVDETKARDPDAPAILQWLLGSRLTVERNESVNVLTQLALSMRMHSRGGILLVVPAGSRSWLDSILQPMTYSIIPVQQGLAELVRQPDEQMNRSVWQSALRRQVDHLAGLTAIDGATVVNDQHELLTFGAKIGRKAGGTRVERISLIEPIEGGSARLLHPGQSGGTRHLSAAQFIHDQRDSMAMVASQDGQFTVFTWSWDQEIVLAHRIESLLL
ncbi:MAG TPA: hypothetical protein VGD92_10855 [Sphingobacteriaceae bacterium]